mgnify:CR=1 FL=1
MQYIEVKFLKYFLFMETELFLRGWVVMEGMTNFMKNW